MTSQKKSSGFVQAKRLDKVRDLISNFAATYIHPLSRDQRHLIEADRCYFCYDAPCTTACPTDIDIPGFIQKIRSDNIHGSAQTIFRENIMGGMCARVCPTEMSVRRGLRAGIRTKKSRSISAYCNVMRRTRYFERSTLQLFTNAARQQRQEGCNRRAVARPAYPAHTGWQCSVTHPSRCLNRDSKLGGS